MNYGFGYYGNNFGQTETIFTTSGGYDYTRLISQIGAAPGCALGNCCGGFNSFYESGIYYGWNSLGVIVDIPNDRRAAIVRNTVGGYW